MGTMGFAPEGAFVNDALAEGGGSAVTMGARSTDTDWPAWTDVMTPQSSPRITVRNVARQDLCERTNVTSCLGIWPRVFVPLWLVCVAWFVPFPILRGPC